jgi:uncharacterized protein (DUF2062 family)
MLRATPDARRASRLRRAVDLWNRARAEHASPRQIAGAVAVGLLACCSPMLGFHCFIALGLATLFRVNRLWAAVASQASIFGLLRAPIVFAEIELGHYGRTRAWAPLDLRTIVVRAPSLMLDWALGAIPFCLVAAALGGLVTYAALGLVAAIRNKRLRPLAPSSGSSPSCSRSPAR